MQNTAIAVAGRIGTLMAAPTGGSMKRLLFIFCLGLFLALPASRALAVSTASEKDEARIGREVLRDLAEKSKSPALSLLDYDHCDNSRPGAGVCWKRCSYSVSSCANSCGVTSEEGSGECWSRCTFSVSSCGQICGTRTRSGNAECWNRCTYSIESCRQICGV